MSRLQEPPLRLHLYLERCPYEQWGIVDGRDPFLYGEKIKAYLRQGARKLQGMGSIPIHRWDMGRCV